MAPIKRKMQKVKCLSKLMPKKQTLRVEGRSGRGMCNGNGFRVWSEIMQVYQGPLELASLTFKAEWRKFKIEDCLEEELVEDLDCA